MLIATSLMCTGDLYEMENQKKALQSWKTAGFEIVSCNVLAEIERLKIIFPTVKFIEVFRSGIERTGKPFPYIVDLLEALRKNTNDGNEVCGLVNSDIIFRKLSAKHIENYLFEHEDTVLYLHRYDIENDDDYEGKYYFSGIDAFFLLSKHLRKFPDRSFMLGRPEWDHWFLYEATNAGMKVREMKNKVAFHIKHKQRWTPTESNQIASNNVGEKGNAYLDEQYYYKTNVLMADLSNRILFDSKEEHYDEVERQEKYYVDIDREALLDWERETYGRKDVPESIGIVYFKGNKTNRICALHREVNINQNQTFSLGEILPDERGKGSILKYIDFKDFDFFPDLGKVYVYPAGRASRLLIDCLDTYHVPVLGMIDRDSSLWGTRYMGKEIFDLSVLEDESAYDHILIATNLYVKEIYESLSRKVSKEKLILL